MRKLAPGTETEQVRTWIPSTLRRKLNVRREQLGLRSESEYLRRLIENACAGIPSEPEEQV